MKSIKHLKNDLNAEILNCTKNGTEQKHVAFEYHDEVHLENKQIKAISININDLLSQELLRPVAYPHSPRLISI